MSDTVPAGGSTEPVIAAATISGVATALVAVFVAFGAHITTDQSAALIGAVGVIGPVVLAFFARSKVTPLAAPKSALGEPLVPASEAAPRGGGEPIAPEGDGGI